MQPDERFRLQQRFGHGLQLLVLGVQRPPFFDAAPAADDAVHHVGRPRPLAGRNGPLGPSSSAVSA